MQSVSWGVISDAQFPGGIPPIRPGPWPAWRQLATPSVIAATEVVLLIVAPSVLRRWRWPQLWSRPKRPSILFLPHFCRV